MCRMPFEQFLKGFTLVELLAVVLILGVTMGLVVPAFSHLVAANRLGSEARRLLSAIHLTRSEAIQRNMPIRMCPSTMAHTGERACSGKFADGWIVFADADGDRNPGPSELVLGAYLGLPEGFTLTNRNGTRDAVETITYMPDGTSRRNRTLLLCAVRYPDVRSWSIVMNLVGRPRIDREWGTCPQTDV